MPTPSVPPWRHEYPFAPHWLEVGGDRLHYLDEGPRDAPPVLFVHGNPTWSFHWRRLVGALRQSHRCVAIDHLGCGLSDKPQRQVRLAERIDHLARLIDRLQLTAATLVAQDWGGAIGLGALAQRRASFERVLLYNTGAWPPSSIPLRIAACKTPVLGRIALQGANVFSLAALRMTMSRTKLAPEVAAGYLAPYDSWQNRRAVYGFVEDIPRTPRHPTWQTLEAIERSLPELRDRPTKLVWGMRDWCFTPACLEYFQQLWPQAETVRLADAGHWVVEDAPEESLEALRSFLPQ